MSFLSPKSLHVMCVFLCACVGFEKEEKAKSLEEVNAAPQSAFLGPTLWDKTLPYDGDNFQLEYMDLEEFLSENGIPSSPAQHEQTHQRQQPPVLSAQTSTSVVNISRAKSAAMPPACIHNSSQSGTGKLQINLQLVLPQPLSQPFPTTSVIHSHG